MLKSQMPNPKIFMSHLDGFSSWKRKTSQEIQLAGSLYTCLGNQKLCHWLCCIPCLPRRSAHFKPSSKLSCELLGYFSSICHLGQGGPYNFIGYISFANMLPSEIWSTQFLLWLNTKHLLLCTGAVFRGSLYV